jgi:serine protease Do
MYRLRLLGLLALILVGVTASAQTATPQAEQDKAAKAQDKAAKAQDKAVKAQEKAAKAEDSAWTGSAIQFNLDGSYLGVFVEEVTADRMKELGLTQERGAVIMKVVKDSPAEKAGLKENDVIVSFNGRPVDSVKEFERLLGETPAGRNVAIEVLRNGNRQTVSAVVSKRDNLGLARNYMENADRLSRQWQDFTPPAGNFPPLNSNFDVDAGGTFFPAMRPRLGISAEPITDQLAGFFGVKEGHGVLVSEVTEGSPAAKAGLKAGDVIVAIDDGRIENVSDLRDQLSKKQEGAVVFKLVRNHQETSVTVNLEKVNPNRRAQRVAAPGVRIFRPLQTI